MNSEDIKIGETYYVRVKVTATSTNRFVCQPLNVDGTKSDFCPNFFNFAEAEAFYKSIPEASPPKHDPCRPFKKGDKVRYEPKLGRYEPHITNGSICTVLSDERNGRVQIEYCDDESVYSATIPFFFLELVTPVEELEPYELVETTDYWSVEKENEELCLFWKKHHPNAKEAAEAECDRLNAEWRKEHEND